jgi:subtilisin family serine protease
MKCTSFHIAFAIILVAHALDAQQLIVNRQGTKVAYPAGTHVVDIMNNGALVSSSSVSDDETARYIVEISPVLNSQPSLNKSVASMAAAAASARLEVKGRMEAIASGVQTLREFTTFVNGYCISTKRANIAAISAIPGVAHVYEDVKVNSFPVTAASTATATVSPLLGIASAKGVRIGIIDTGIDYLHEALGGGFGANFKVRGGYDFVNNDSDPMDDNGHGTHVAGIIAGDSKTITGMASGAVLYAYKALDAAGNGYSSMLIAALERAMQDSVKVINMSLGSLPGDPDDILSQAVDRAVASGIIVVVAAGNGGDFGKIGSPGAARNALTVGAVDSKNIPAAFSSKGPVQKNFGLKPDVVAPGVSILSAKSGGGYIAMSGTSMSAPYVAAIAAALCEVYPTWSSAQIRNAIIGSAQHLPYSYFTVGTGMADPIKAIQPHSVATPGMMSLGFNTNNTSVWTMPETVYVSNVYPTPQTYRLSGSGSAPGISLQFAQPSLTIAPYSQAMIVANISADNSVLADNLSINDGYTGAITAASATDTVCIPFGFFKGTILRFQFDECPWQVLIHNRKNTQYAFQPKTTDLSVALPAGTYDVITQFNTSYYVVREGVQASGVTDLSIKRGEAVHPITLAATDEFGVPIDKGLAHEVFSATEGLIHRGSGISMISPSGGPYTAAKAPGPKYVSDLSPAYVFGYTLNIQNGNITTYTYETAIDSGITGAVNILFKPEEVKRLDVKYDIDSAKIHSVFPVVWLSLQQQTTMNGTTYYDGTAEPLRYPFTQTSFYYKRTSPAFPVFHSREAYKY